MSSSYRDIHFNALPEKARLRLAACLSGQAEPQPLLQLPGARKRGWIMLFLIGVLFLLGTWAAGMDRTFLSEGGMVSFGLGALFTVAGIVGIMHVIRLRRAMPFRPGRYLFATDFIDARRPVLRFYNLNELQSLNATHHHYNGIYTGTRFVIKLPGKTVQFSISGKKKADECLSRINIARATFVHAVRMQDVATLEAMDPLFEARVSNEWKDLSAKPASLPRDAAAQCREVPWPFSRWYQAWGLGLLAALALGPALWWLSNRYRDEAMFARAQRTRSEGDYRLYLAGGKKHAEEVRANLLPQAVFYDAKRRSSVKRFREFQQEFPTHSLAATVPQEVHAIYANSLQRTLQRADPSAHDFLRKLFTWLEQNNSPSVDVRFGPPSSESLTEADRVLAADGGKMDGLPVAPIAPSFTTERCQAREQRIIEQLGKGFKGVSGEILTLSRGKRVSKNENGKLARPTLAIHYIVKPSDMMYKDDNATRAFVGITIDFTLDLSVPDAGAPMHLAFSVEPPQRFTVQTRSNSKSRPRLEDSSVYETMATEAFLRLDERLAATFFKNDGK
jgi:hypothetical protein